MHRQAASAAVTKKQKQLRRREPTWKKMRRMSTVRPLGNGPALSPLSGMATGMSWCWPSLLQASGAGARDGWSRTQSRPYTSLGQVMLIAFNSAHMGVL